MPPARIAVIVGNPVLIDAYNEGTRGRRFPDGAKMAKIHWNPKKQEANSASLRFIHRDDM